jgi:hypothetical protein
MAMALRVASSKILKFRRHQFHSKKPSGMAPGIPWKIVIRPSVRRGEV